MYEITQKNYIKIAVGIKKLPIKTDFIVGQKSVNYNEQSIL